MTPTPKDLAVIIVTWNTRALALETLESLYADLATSGLAADVYLVDSASSDGTPQAIAQHFPQVILTASPDNLGFARANNVALRQAGFDGSGQAPRAAYLLNPDTHTQAGATRALFDALMAEPDIGVVGANLTYGDGSFQHGAFAFPGLRQLWAEFFPTPGRFIEGRFNGRYPRALYNGASPFEVDFTLGATWMLRREVVQQVGMFDESFFMYCEEIDWAWRIRKAGWRILSVPRAHVTHYGGQSTAQVRPRAVIDLWTSRLALFEKHYPAWKRALAYQLVVAGMTRKAAREQDPELRTAYLTVKRMAQDA